MNIYKKKSTMNQLPLDNFQPVDPRDKDGYLTPQSCHYEHINNQSMGETTVKAPQEEKEEGEYAYIDEIQCRKLPSIPNKDFNSTEGDNFYGSEKSDKEISAKNRCRSKTIVIVSVALLICVVAAVVFGVIFAYRNGQSGNSTEITGGKGISYKPTDPNEPQIFSTIFTTSFDSNRPSTTTEASESTYIGYCSGNTSSTLESGRGRLETVGYADYSDCLWKIQVAEDEIPLFTIETMDVLKGVNFCSDRLAFYDSFGRATFFLCGTITTTPIKPFTFTSGESSMTVRLQSDGTGTGKGFKGSWKSGNYDDVLCRGRKTLTDMVGEISSNPGTYSYVNNAFCEWNITVPEKHRISLVLNEIDIADGDDLTIYDGPSTSSEVLMTTSGSRPNSVQFVSSGRSVFISFSSNSIGTKTGFLARYTALPGF